MGSELLRHPEMILIAAHDVHVERKEIIRDTSSCSSAYLPRKQKRMKVTKLESRSFRRSINLIDVACRFIGSYCELSLTENPCRLLATSESSLEIIMAFACFLKIIIEPIVRYSNVHGITWADMVVKGNVVQNQPEILKDSLVSVFQPTPRSRKRIFHHLF